MGPSLKKVKGGKKEEDAKLSVCIGTKKKKKR